MNKPIIALLSDVEDVEERMSYLADTMALLLYSGCKTNQEAYDGAMAGLHLSLMDLTEKLDGTIQALYDCERVREGAAV